MSPAIAFRGVHKSYAGVHALRGIDLSIARGEFFGLLGPNGAGKSTLINITAGLTRPTQGSVAVMGHDVVAHYRRARRCLGVVPQEITYDPFFTVREFLQIQAGYFGLGRRRSGDWIDELLAALMLADKADANMRALSGGMKRRVLIAQALVHRPEVVILDEPTAGVDVELRKSLWAFISRLHREGHTIVLTTHYLEEAQALCGRIAIMNHGSIIALDTTANLLSRDGGARHVTVTVARPLTALPPPLRDRLLAMEANRLELQLRRGEDSIVAVIDALRAAGAEITDLHTAQADLEDVFVDLTNGRPRTA